MELALLSMLLLGASLPVFASFGGSAAEDPPDPDADSQRTTDDDDAGARPNLLDFAEDDGPAATADAAGADGKVPPDHAGGPGNDTLTGTGDDVVRGRSGDDSLTGFDDAEVWGGTGDDQVDVFGDYGLATDGSVGHGGQGDDTLRAEGYGALVQGDRGDDTLYVAQDAFGNGGRGDDTVRVSEDATGRGGRGEDLMLATDGGDAFGGAGRDFMVASTGTDVFGGQGDDWISVHGDFYPPHGDTSDAFGGAGDDLFAMSRGAIATGGEGADNFVVFARETLNENPFPDARVTISDFDAATDRILVDVDQPVTSFTLTEQLGGTLARIATGQVGLGPLPEGVEIFLPGVTGLSRDDFDLVDSITGSFQRGPDFGLQLGAVSPL